MYVYVISASDDRQKIGKARDPEERRRLLQSGSTLPLDLVHSQRVQQPRNVEVCAHEKLASRRLHGEWFNATRDEAISAVRAAVDELGGELPPLATELRLPRKIVDGVGLEARRQSSRAYHAKREAAGLKKVTLWLSPEARSVLDAKRTEYGSKDAAAEAAIRKL